MIEIVRAKNNENKLEVMDNRPFVIEMDYDGDRKILVNFYDIFGKTRKKKTLWYRKMADFTKEWEFIDSLNYQIRSFDLINYYQE